MSLTFQNVLLKFFTFLVFFCQALSSYFSIFERNRIIHQNNFPFPDIYLFLPTSSLFYSSYVEITLIHVSDISQKKAPHYTKSFEIVVASINDTSAGINNTNTISYNSDW
jgi:hypothetical protein